METQETQLVKSLYDAGELPGAYRSRAADGVLDEACIFTGRAFDEILSGWIAAPDSAG